jgi:hypothetical protein
MFEALRKYGSVFMLVLMSMVMVCLVADENGDSQQLVTRTATSTCMTVLADDFDLEDDDEDEICNHFFGNKCSTWTWAVASDVRKLEGSKCPSDLLRGQVRRYSPRNNLSDSHNYTLLSIMKSGVDLFHATFFVPYTSFLTQILHNAGTRPKVGSRSIFQTTIL